MEESENKILVLTPTIIGQDDKAFQSVINLRSALNNAEIKNIALTGPYGSGKSSVLKTLQVNAGEFNFLNISLATLEVNEKLNNSKPQTPQNESDKCPLEKCKIIEKETSQDINQLIEYSILQQIIYKEKPESIPQSRFKRIKHISPEKSHKFAFGTLGFIISLLIILKPDWFSNNQLYKMISLDKSLDLLYQVLALGYFFYSIYSTIKYLSVALYNNNLNKINLKDGEIEIAETTSIFNKHLDEILYFFEVTSCNVVIFEDLDRFKNHNIFLKLRELNTLINESKAVNRRIVFIYAVRDDIFQDTSRTKFFDYIETIIPVINPSNACDQLYNLLKNSKVTEISPTICKELGQFIDDMRTLKNIVNEFVQYRTRLDDKLVARKMLGMIIYKNYFPEDFSLLHNNDGIVYKAINKKDKYTETITGDILQKIEQLKVKLNEVERQNKLKISELKSIYVLKYTQLWNKFVFFITENNEELSIAALVESDELFGLLQSNQIVRYGYLNPANRLTISQFDIKFNVIERDINPNKTYQNRVDEIAEGYYDELIQKITELENDRDNIRSLPLTNILTEYEIQEYNEITQKYRLIDFLLQQGYIDEEYYRYISYFYEGTITPKDHEFLLDLMRKKKYDYHYKLQSIEILIKQIPQYSYKHESILNLSLLDYIIENSSKYKREINMITDILFKKRNIEFTRLLYSNSSSIHLYDFYLVLFDKWEGFWIDVQNKNPNENEFDEFVEIYLQFRPRVLSRPDDELFSTYINKNYILVKNIYDRLNLSDIITTLKLIDCKFHNIVYLNELDIIMGKVVSLNLYEINAQNIREGLKFEADENTVKNYFDTESYTTILGNFKESSIAYINTNLDDCLNTYFPESSVHESEETIITLLNLDSSLVKQDTRDNYLLKQLNKISDIRKINEDVWEIALILNIVKPTWENISLYFESINLVLDGTLVEFVDDNIEVLRDIIVPKSLNTDTIGKMYIEFIGTNKLSLESFKLLNLLFQRSFEKYDFSQLEEERLLILIRCKCIKYNEDNFKLIEVNFSSEVLFEFCCNNNLLFIQDVGNHILSEKLFTLLIGSDTFNNSEKQVIIDTNLTLDIITSKKTANVLVEFSLLFNAVEISYELMNQILTLSDLNSERVLFAITILNKFGWQNDKITRILSTLGGNYSVLTKKRTKPNFRKNDENELLFAKLMSVGYISKVIPKDDKIKVTTKYK